MYLYIRTTMWVVYIRSTISTMYYDLWLLFVCGRMIAILESRGRYLSMYVACSYIYICVGCSESRSESNHNPSQSSARWYSYLWGEFIVEAVINNQSITRNESPRPCFQGPRIFNWNKNNLHFTPSLSCSSSSYYRHRA